MSDVDFALADPDPLGKCTVEIKVSLPELVADDIALLASLHGVTKSAYLRRITTEHCRGVVEAVRLRALPPLRSSSGG